MQAILLKHIDCHDSRFIDPMQDNTQMLLPRLTLKHTPKRASDEMTTANPLSQLARRLKAPLAVGQHAPALGTLAPLSGNDCLEVVARKRQDVVVEGAGLQEYRLDAQPLGRLERLQRDSGRGDDGNRGFLGPLQLREGCHGRVVLAVHGDTRRPGVDGGDGQVVGHIPLEDCCGCQRFSADTTPGMSGVKDASANSWPRVVQNQA